MMTERSFCVKCQTRFTSVLLYKLSQGMTNIFTALVFFSQPIWLRMGSKEFALLLFALSGTKNRLGTESGYSSLEKTSPRVVDAQAHTDSRSDCVSVSSSAAHLCMFPTTMSLSPSPFPPPTNHNSQGACGVDPEDVVGFSWERSLESNGERQSHTSMTHTLRHESPSPRRKVHRLFGSRHR